MSNKFSKYLVCPFFEGIYHKFKIVNYLYYIFGKYGFNITYLFCGLNLFSISGFWCFSKIAVDFSFFLGFFPNHFTFFFSSLHWFVFFILCYLWHYYLYYVIYNIIYNTKKCFVKNSIEEKKEKNLEWMRRD